MKKRLLMYIKDRMILVLLAACIISGAVASAVYAKYVKSIDSNVDVTIVGYGDIEVAVEKQTDGSYTIKHGSGSNIPAYIRFTVVTNWKQKEGGALWYEGPEPGKVTVTAPNAQLLSDGYYYCYCVVEGKKKAEIAIDKVISGIEVTTTDSPPSSDYELDVQIVAEAIQCVPADAVKNAWGVTFNGTNWVKK